MLPTDPEILPAALTIPGVKVSDIPGFSLSELKLKYTQVESSEQKSQYVKDFNDDYGEYLKLNAKMKEYSDKFSGLNDQLNAFTEGSPDYQRIRSEIITEYKKALNNGYDIKRKRFDFLKAKLALIRELIEAYKKQAQAEAFNEIA